MKALIVLLFLCSSAYAYDKHDCIKLKIKAYPSCSIYAIIFNVTNTMDNIVIYHTQFNCLDGSTDLINVFNNEIDKKVDHKYCR